MHARISRAGAIPALCLVTLSVAGCASPGQSTASAVDPSGAAVVRDETASNNPNAKSCRNYRETGSRTTQRVCKYNYQWQAEAEQSRKALRDVQRDNSISASGE